MRRNPGIAILAGILVLIGGLVVVGRKPENQVAGIEMASVEFVQSDQTASPADPGAAFNEESVGEHTQPTETTSVKPTPRAGLVATDPSTVNLASGEIQLVEFFAFW
jgi:hypothetical protein